MSDTLQPDAIEPLLRATISAPRLSVAQRQRHLERLGLLPGATPMRLQPALAGATLEETSHGAADYPERSWRSRRGWAELAVVAAVAVLLVVGVVFAQNRVGDGTGEAEQGVPADLVAEAVEPLAPGEGQHMIIRVQSDLRVDQGLLLEWSLESWRRVLADGTRQEHFIMRDPDGTVVTTFTINGESWWWDQYGWVETGSLSLGIMGVSVHLSSAMNEPAGTASRFFGETADADIEVIRDGNRDIYRIQGDGATSSQQVAQFDVTVTGSAFDMVRDRETGNVLETRSYLTTEEGVEITFARTTFVMLEELPADQIDAGLFAPPPPSDELQYTPPAADALPLGLSLSSHIEDFPAGRERLVLESDDLSLTIWISPSTGGFDPSNLIATRSDPSVVQTSESDAGPVTWMGSSLAGQPRAAFWDDGRFRFELSVPEEPLAEGWDEATLIAVVEALSGNAGAGTDELPAADGGPGVPVELLTGLTIPLEPGQGLHSVMDVHTDRREDDGALLDWRVERWQRTLADGTQQERVVLLDATGRAFTTVVRNGPLWSRTSGDWVVTGDDTGINPVPVDVSLSMAEPNGAAQLLGQLAEGLPAENAAAEVETFTDERGDVTRIGGMGDGGFEQESVRYGVTVTGFFYELIHDPETGNLLQTRGYLDSEEGVQIVFGQWDFVLVEALPAEEMDAALFEVAPEPESLQFDAPEQLPGGFSLDSHINDFMRGGEQLVYASNGAHLVINVLPSLGGYDPSDLLATRSADAVVETIDSAAGPVTWVASQADVPPAGAYWDDGRAYFELSVAGDAPAGWDVAALIAVVEALSGAR